MQIGESGAKRGKWCKKGKVVQIVQRMAKSDSVGRKQEYGRRNRRRDGGGGGGGGVRKGDEET